MQVYLLGEVKEGATEAKNLQEESKLKNDLKFLPLPPVQISPWVAWDSEVKTNS